MAAHYSNLTRRYPCRELRDAGRGRPVLGEALRGRPGGAMRVAQRQIRCVVASRSDCLGRDAAGQGPRKVETRHGGDAEDEKDQHRSAEESIRGCAVRRPRRTTLALAATWRP